MNNVIKFPQPSEPAASFDSIAWLRKKLDEGQPEHQAEFIRNRIEILEARVGIQPKK